MQVAQVTGWSANPVDEQVQRRRNYRGVHLEQVHGVREPGDDVVDPLLGRLHHFSLYIFPRCLPGRTKKMNTGNGWGGGGVSDNAKKKNATKPAA